MMDGSIHSKPSNNGSTAAETASPATEPVPACSLETFRASALSAQAQDRLDALYTRLQRQRECYLGYPNSHALDNAHIARFLDFALNNVGDPFLGNNGMNTCDFECEVLEFLADITHIAKHEYFGYVTSGSTEAITYGLYRARESFPNGVLLHSQDAHYGIPKAAKILGIPHTMVRAQAHGEVDYDDLRRVVRENRHRPIIMVANIGTTMKGAIDNLEQIFAILQEFDVQQHHIHCDAALFGCMLPFIPNAPITDFRLPIRSLSISGHKFIGCPIPCGVILMRRRQLSGVMNTVEYIGSMDTTLMGSRAGIPSLLLWNQIQRIGRDGFARLARISLQLAQYALEKLHAADWPAWLNPHSNTVVIKRPNTQLIRKWQLASEGEWSHIITMPGVTIDMIDSFVEDLKNPPTDGEEFWSNYERRHPRPSL